MIHTTELIEEYLKKEYKINTEINLYNYELNGTVIKVRFNIKKEQEDISELEIKYDMLWREYSEEINLLDYITFVSQLNNK